MLSVIADGLSVLYIYKEAIVVFFVTVFGIGFFSTGIVVDRAIDIKIRLLASFCVGSILLCLISFGFIVLFHYFGFPLKFGSYVLLLFAIFILVKGFLSGEFRQAYTLHTLATAVAFFFLLLARLAFLKHSILPPYSDSPIHYQIVSEFLDPKMSSVSKLSLQTIFRNYYHYGFHSLVVWLTSITEFDAAKMISLVGQLFLVIAPLSISFLIYALTHDGNGAMFAGLLTAVGWLMPAFAVNWGKFPALASVAMLPVAVSLPLLLFDRRLDRTRVVSYGLILLMGIVFVHTRTVICLLLIFADVFIVSKLRIENKFGFFQSTRFTLLFVISLWPLSHLLIDFYNKAPILIILLILMPFAFQTYPAISIGDFVFLSGISLITFIPNLLSVGGQALLDRQFLEIMLYVPLSLMGGLGFGGLVKKLETHLALKWIVVAVLIGCVLANITPLSFYPDSCCNYFKENDRLAFEWIRDNSSSHTLFFISTINDGSKTYGTDAGIWITPLQKIATNKLPFNTQWNSIVLLNEICSSSTKDTYIYMGGRENSFDNNQLSQSAWVSPVFRAGEVVIYKISDCKV